jgi:hypothetical protein
MDRGRLLRHLREVLVDPAPPPIRAPTLDGAEADVDQNGRPLNGPLDASLTHSRGGGAGAWTIDGDPVDTDTAPVWSASWVGRYYVVRDQTIWRVGPDPAPRAVLRLDPLQLPGPRVVNALLVCADGLYCWFQDRWVGLLFEDETAFAYLWEMPPKE